MSRFLWIFLVLLVMLAIAGGIAALSAYRATQHVPEFYVVALETEPENMEKAGDELERRVLALQNEVNHDGRWQAVFTTEQINGWLAADLAEKFPGVLSETVSEPRVALADGQIHVACRHEGQGINTIISFSLEPYLTENPNQLAVRMHNLRAGALPLPMGKVLDRVAHAAAHAELRLEWGQEGNDPVALVTLPSTRPELRRNYHVDELVVGDDQIVITGHTTPPGQEPSAEPGAEAGGAMAAADDPSLKVKFQARAENEKVNAIR